MSENVVRMAVHVQPGARQNLIVGFANDALQVKVAAPPVKGKANKELVVFLSKTLGVSKSSVVIEKGLASKRKIISIAGLTQEQFEAKLQNLV